MDDMQMDGNCSMACMKMTMEMMTRMVCLALAHCSIIHFVHTPYLAIVSIINTVPLSK